MAKKSLGINDLLNRTFKSYKLEDPWHSHLGVISQNFQMMVFGHPKNGKTSYLMQLTKYLASFASVYYNSIEEGACQTMQDQLIRFNMQDVAGSWVLGDRDSYADMVEKLEKQGSARIVVIDSRDYMRLTTEQYKKLRKLFPRKAFIIVCWEQAGKPAGKFAKDIEYMMDIVVNVSQFKAKSVSRFGGFGTYTIWNKKPVNGPLFAEAGLEN